MSAAAPTQAMTVDHFRDGFRAWLAPDGAGAEVLAPFRPAPAGSHEDHVALGLQLSAVLWEHGWKRHGWPETVGGVGGGPRHRAVYYDELCRAGLFVPESDQPTEVLAPAVLHHAPDLAEHVLPGLLAGREVWGQGFSEPDAGSDLASLRTRATPAGSGYRINGQKTWMSNGHLADRLFVLARTGTQESRHRGITAFMLDADAPGVTRRPLVFASGVTELCEVFFDDVEVPADAIVGQADGGWAVAMYLLQYERSMYAAQRQAWLLARLRDLAALVGTTSDHAAAPVLGRAWAAVGTVRARTAETVRRLDAGEMVGPEASADKILLATAEQAVFDAAKDLLGAGFLLDPDNRDWRDQWWYSRAATIYGGSIEVQRTILADHVLSLPPETSKPSRVEER